MSSCRHLQFETLAEAVEEARRLHKNGYVAEGNWSLAEMLDHLTGAMRASREGFDPSVKPVHPLVRFLLSRLTWWWWIQVRSRLPRNVPAPPAMAPAADLDEAEALTAFEREVEAVSDWDGPWSRHPFFGVLSESDWRRFHRIHAAHHLACLTPES